MRTNDLSIISVVVVVAELRLLKRPVSSVLGAPDTEEETVNFHVNEPPRRIMRDSEGGLRRLISPQTWLGNVRSLNHASIRLRDNGRNRATIVSQPYGYLRRAAFPTAWPICVWGTWPVDQVYDQSENPLANVIQTSYSRPGESRTDYVPT
ncbi:hypothetical protein FOXB_08997 [Fusarium oxysporum f. sp. conglutinans Fo5176]|uniref:Uncharacterized protein n=1 Tax=Fusarium oxysporum (strain Fo5176) TaxID=660025 RepID=F9FRG7_FUSOF|nr:hypothetical protein FOXB_08997 [Fusarium oxysporum f. sp. conglutinans Fo5176]